MDDFTFALKKSVIEKETRKTQMKTLIRDHYAASDSFYINEAYKMYSSYTPLEEVHTALSNYKLSRLALARYPLVGGDVNKLPQFASRVVHVNVNMTLQEAHDWIKNANQDNETL